MKKILIFSLLFLCSCNGRAEKHCYSSNPNYEVSLLFEVDGIKVYRFKDGLTSHYFCSAGRTISQKSRQAGKHRVHWDEEIETVE